MKWLKLDCDYAEDPAICLLAREWGSDAARAFWPMLLGFVAEHMKERSCRVKIEPDGEINMVYFARRMHSHPNVLRSRLNRCGNVGLMSLERWENDSEIFIPNMLKRFKIGKVARTPKKEEGRSKSKERKGEGTAPPSGGPPLADTLFEIYNSYRGEMPKCFALSDERRRKCRARLSRYTNGHGQTFVDQFTRAIQKAAGLPFMLGMNARHWKAGFDWFIANDTNYLKVLEGKYDHSFTDDRRDVIPPLYRPEYTEEDRIRDEAEILQMKASQ